MRCWCPLLPATRRVRLGYGGGFYDCTHQRSTRTGQVTAVGVGFDAQLVPEVPHGRTISRLDWLLTDRRALALSEA